MDIKRKHSLQECEEVSIPSHNRKIYINGNMFYQLYNGHERVTENCGNIKKIFKEKVKVWFLFIIF
jgi:hypothetical protein